MKVRIALASKQWTSGNLVIDYAGVNKRNQRFIVLHLLIAGRLVARVQLKGKQIYELANLIVDADESIDPLGTGSIGSSS